MVFQVTLLQNMGVGILISRLIKTSLLVVIVCVIFSASSAVESKELIFNRSSPYYWNWSWNETVDISVDTSYDWCKYLMSNVSYTPVQDFNITEVYVSVGATSAKFDDVAKTISSQKISVTGLNASIGVALTAGTNHTVWDNILGTAEVVTTHAFGWLVNIYNVNHSMNVTTNQTGFLLMSNVTLNFTINNSLADGYGVHSGAFFNASFGHANYTTCSLWAASPTSTCDSLTPTMEVFECFGDELFHVCREDVDGDANSITEYVKVIQENATTNVTYVGGGVPELLYCNATAGLYIEGNLSYLDIEQGSNVSVCATANDSTSQVCISIGHGEWRYDPKCGVNSTALNWTAESNAFRFNDSSVGKVLNFSAAGTVNRSIFQIYNDSEIESFYFTIYGIKEDGSYAKNVKINYESSNIAVAGYDFISWGELQSGQTNASEFNNSATSYEIEFQDRNSTAVYIKLSPDHNVSSATLDLVGKQNDYFQDDLITNRSLDDNGTTFGITIPLSLVHQDDSDYVYMFGWECVSNDCGGGETDYNMTARYTLGGGYGSFDLLAESPWATRGGGAVYYPTDNATYVFGGYKSAAASTSNKTYQYDISSNTWTEKAEMPKKSRDLLYVLRDGTDEIYMCGGKDEAGSYNNTCSVYDVSDNDHTIIEDMASGGLANGWAENLNSSTLIFWGINSSNSRTTLLYDISGDDWQETGALVPSNTAFLTGVSVNDKIYSFNSETMTVGAGTISYTVITRYDESTHTWERMSSNMSLDGTEPLFLGGRVEEVENHTVYISPALGNVGGFTEASVYFYPYGVSVTVQDYASASQTITGDVAGTTPITDLSTEINDQLIGCTNDSVGYCNLRLLLSNFGAGNITAQNLEILTTLSDLNLGVFNVSCLEADGWCENNFEVSSGAKGLVVFTNLSINYLGTSNILFFRNDSNTNSSTTIANIFFSDWTYALAQDYGYIEFIPSTPTSANVTPFGQTPNYAMINITTDNTGGRNMSFYFAFNDSDNTVRCVNTTVSNSSTKNDGIWAQNFTWYKFLNNYAPKHNFGLWFWEDYNCNYTNWYMWQPEFLFRGCCEGCYCSEDFV